MNRLRLVLPTCVLLLVCAGVGLNASPLEPAQSMPFMICLQDDNNGRIIRITTFDGSFRYENCASGNVVTGKGTIVVVDQTLVLSSKGVSATVNLTSNSGSASVQEFNGSPSLINDSNTTNSGCVCPET